WPRPKYLLFGFMGLMYAYVLWTNESFLFNSKDPEWAHIDPFKWWLLPHGLAAACALFLACAGVSPRCTASWAASMLPAFFWVLRSESTYNISRSEWSRHAPSQSRPRPTPPCGCSPPA